MSRGLLCFVLAALSLAAAAQGPQAPRVGQPGRDVVWVPTPHTLVEKMLDMARVTPADYVMDLGSGDGRNIIAAAKRGARALGVEYDAELVAVARRNAARHALADRARFVQGDMFDADISQATVLALFLVPDNLRRLKPKFDKLKPGTRIVTNGFKIEGWEAQEVGRAERPCGGWCVAYLYIVP
jgi:SAM-dependent methyltransferase